MEDNPIEIIDPNDPRDPLSIPWAEPTHDQIMEVLHALQDLSDKRREALGIQPGGDPPFMLVVDECAELQEDAVIKDAMAEILRLGRKHLDEETLRQVIAKELRHRPQVSSLGRLNTMRDSDDGR
jgi:hypothetical protein